MLSTHRKILYALGIPCLTMFLGCSTSTSENIDVQQSSLRIGSHQVLSQAEWQTYAADRQYIQSLAKPDVPVRLNLADDQQYRFVRTRLKIAGKTSKNSPYLMEAIEARRKEHLSLGVTKGLLPGASYTTESESTNSHFMAAATAGTTADPNLGEAVSTATILDQELDGIPYVYTDSGYYDFGSNPLADLAYTEEFGEGAVTSARAEADLSLAVVSAYILDSYHLSEDEEGFIEDSYVFTQTGAVNTTGRPQAPLANLTAVTEPEDKDGDNDIEFCLERRDNTCDYYYAPGSGMRHKVRLPLQGSLALASDHFIRQSDIDDILNDLNADPASTVYGHLKLLLKHVGAYCDVQADDALHPSIRQVWSNVIVADGGKTLSWDLTGNNMAVFDDRCAINTDVYLTMRLSIPVRDAGGIKFLLDVTLSNEATVTTAIHNFEPMHIVNSCLAAGTMIQLPDGSEVAIESIGTGDRVSNPFHADAHALTVTDISTGGESTPMYRLEDEAGHTILMTEMHPIQTPDRGMVAAKYMREGDTVMTRTGPSKLVRITREKYDGKVYNLRIGSESEMASLGQAQTVMYANGFMVGDLQIQHEYEAEDLVRKKQGDVLERLPARWHRDYQMSQAAKAARNASTPNGGAAAATLAN